MIAEKLDRKSFAAALAMHRDRLGYTQQEAADACRIKLRTWSDWENEKGGTPKYPTMRGTLEILREIKVKKSNQ